MALHESTRYQNENYRRSIVPVPWSRSAEHALCPELLMLWFCTFHRTISCLHVDFEFKLALWPTLRQKFMNFSSFWHVQAINMTKRSTISCFSNHKLVQGLAHNSDSQSHGFLWNIILKWNVSLFNKKLKCFYCIQHINHTTLSERDHVMVLRDICRPFEKNP